jgi:hypothetical protein
VSVLLCLREKRDIRRVSKTKYKNRCLFYGSLFYPSANNSAKTAGNISIELGMATLYKILSSHFDFYALRFIFKVIPHNKLD